MGMCNWHRHYVVVIIINMTSWKDKNVNANDTKKEASIFNLFGATKVVAA